MNRVAGLVALWMALFVAVASNAAPVNAGSRSEARSDPVELSSVTVTDRNGKTTRLAYDPAGNKLTETNWRGQETRYQYDEAHRLTHRIEPTSAVFDVRNRETSRTYSASVDGLSSLSKTYDGNGNVLTETQTDSRGARTTRYQYDAQDQVSQPDRRMAPGDSPHVPRGGCSSAGAESSPDIRQANSSSTVSWGWARRFTAT